MVIPGSQGAPLAGAVRANATTPPPASVQVGPIATEIGSTVQAGPITTAIGAGIQPNQLGVHMYDPLAGIQSRLSIRALGARARSLRREAARRAARFQQQAIAHARSAETGVWVVVNRAGVVLAQSGDIQVTHVGTGAYRVSFAPGSVLADVQVHVTGPDGPADGGFFLAAGC